MSSLSHPSCFSVIHCDLLNFSISLNPLYFPCHACKVADTLSFTDPQLQNQAWLSASHPVANCNVFLEHMWRHTCLLLCKCWWVSGRCSDSETASSKGNVHCSYYFTKVRKIHIFYIIYKSCLWKQERSVCVCFLSLTFNFPLQVFGSSHFHLQLVCSVLPHISSPAEELYVVVNVQSLRWHPVCPAVVQTQDPAVI